jgi:hypothetical protein
MSGRVLFILLLAVLGLPIGTSNRVAAQGMIGAASNCVPLGSQLILTSLTPNSFLFSPATLVTIKSTRTGLANSLCAISAVSCAPSANGTTLTIQIPTAGGGGSQLLGTSWTLTATNLLGLGTATLTQPNAIKFVSGACAAASSPKSAPFVTGVTPNCVAASPFAPNFVTLSVDGNNFDPVGAQVVVSYIYFVGPHGKFRTDYHSHDSRRPATMLFRSTSSLQFSIGLQTIHQQGGDPFDLAGNYAGNYYVQVENPNGKVSDGPMYFTVLPYHGPGMSHCP